MSENAAQAAMGANVTFAMAGESQPFGTFALAVREYPPLSIQRGPAGTAVDPPKVQVLRAKSRDICDRLPDEDTCSIGH